MSRRAKLLFSLAVLTVVVSAGVLISQPADARPPGPPGPPGPLCGFTAIWSCTLPNGDVVEVVGTQCDIRRFERRTGATCTL